MAQKPSLVGSIVERKLPSSFSTPKPSSSAKTGFPTVQHRSKSAFSRNREEIRKFGASRAKNIPSVLPSNTPFSPPSSNTESNDWRTQISRENEERVAAMTEEEREEERQQILERFGTNVGDILKRARSARTGLPDKILASYNGQKNVGQSVQEENRRVQDPVPIISEERNHLERARSPPRSPPPSALITPSSTRPSSRADRRLRFAELEPDDVHVYDSAPSSPKKRKALALPPPDPSQENQVVSLGQWKGKMVPENAEHVEVEPAPIANGIEEPEEPEEGSAEYIRRHFFPRAPKDDPNLAWMDVNSSPAPDSASSSLRFDLHGNPIPASISLSLPTHLGLHHHAEGAHAGYTLDDIFLLSRSTVPAQRATMLSILAHIAKRLEEVKNGNVDGMQELVGKEDDLRKRILAAGVEALSSRGNVGTHAIEVVWECVVGWNSNIMDLEGIELESTTDLTINSLPLEFFLPQIATILMQGGVPHESATQLLSILYRLARQNISIANDIVSTPKLLSSILQTFLLTPVSQIDSSSTLPDPLALHLFYTLALSSRSNAEEIEKLADSLLRFVAFSSFDSPYPPALATTLLVSTLRLYRALASYGLYSHIAGTAVAQFVHIEQFVISEACTSNILAIAWANLVEAWTVCATDPHQTNPPHDILWSQVVGWTWNTGISELQDRLEAHEADWPMWTASWQAQAAWLEGSKINAVKGGEAERLEVMDAVKAGFENGKEAKIVKKAMNALKKELDEHKTGDMIQMKGMANHVSVLSSVVRLWLACVAPHFEGVPTSPPFSLPFAELSEVTRRLLNHPLWLLRTSPSTSLAYRYCREMSQFLSYYLLLSKRLPGTSQSLWLAQAFSILLRLGPGDEDYAQSLILDIFKLLTQEWAESQKIQVSSLIWERGGLSILEPFLLNLVRPQTESYIGPLAMTPQSIKSSTSQRLPPPVSIHQLGLPLRRDWMMSPLDHLLRSGDSSVFKALPILWDSSEVEVARASLFLAKVVQEALLNFSMIPFVLTREESIFGCMKIFMLEHGQQQTDSTEEVFRDVVVGQLMEDILRPYAHGSADAQIISSVAQEQEDLEKVAARFLGPSVPFFQFYTDFVSLYDAISFSHPLFARLLIPPTSMRYALDYRKHLWCDFNHVVRTIRISPSQVLSADIREYLYPLEVDPQIIASYLASLLKDNVHDFMRLVALHHIASNIWPDLRGASTDSENENRASTLLKAIVGQSSIDIIRDVVRYRQTTSGGILLPPFCFQALDDIRTSRLECIMRWGGQVMFDRLNRLLDE